MQDDDKKVIPPEGASETPVSSTAAVDTSKTPSTGDEEGDEDLVSFHDSSDDEREAFFEREEEGEDEEEVEEESQSPEKIRINTGADFLSQELLVRAQRADPKLRANLTGKVLIHLTDNNTKVLLDGSSTEVTVQKVEGEDAAADCVIRLPDKNLMKIYQGRLNPQLAMLSGKVKVEKQATFAVYFFNLVAPRARY
jgi:hypothetical protein